MACKSLWTYVFSYVIWVEFSLWTCSNIILNEEFEG